MGLSVVLLVNKFHYWIVRKVKYNICRKTFLLSTIETTLSLKLLFCIIKVNYFVIKLFLALCLVGMCVYICV